jgi:hypothetical protein
MKKITRFIAPIVLSAALLLPSAAIAADREDYVPQGPVAVTLTQETPLNSWASLSPQTVKVIGVASQTSVYIDTWIGMIEIQYNPKTMTFLIADKNNIGKTVLINKEAALYWSPSFNTKTGLALASGQDVKILDISGNYMKISTWVGDLWVDAYDVTYYRARI